MAQIYEVIKSHIAIARGDALYRTAGRFARIKWKTNELPELDGFITVSLAFDPERFEKLLDTIYPLAEIAVVGFATRGDREGQRLLCDWLEKMQRHSRSSQKRLSIEVLRMMGPITLVPIKQQ
jgi:hypothetical protein